MQLNFFDDIKDERPLEPVTPAYKPPCQEDLEKLWKIVVMQDTPELEAAFMINWLRGFIKIPAEVKGRIKHE